MTTRPQIVILGPQGVGKGTHAARLAVALDIEHLSTGEMLRRAVRARNPLGRSVDRWLSRGDLVPNDVMVTVVRTEIARLRSRDRGFILDGYPRTLGQATDLAAVLDTPLTASIELTASLDILLHRLVRRRVCPGCGTATAAPASHIDAVPCPNGDELAVRRADDTPTTIAHRLAIYDSNSQPLVAWLKRTGRFLSINSELGPDEVCAAILDALFATPNASDRPGCSLDLAFS